MLIFIHIPKTAGQTIHLIMDRQFASGEIYEVKKDIQASYRNFIDMDSTERARYRAIKGHVPYGVHEYIEGPYAYFTFLREPVARTISHYHFLKNKTNHPLASKLREEGMTLDQSIELELDKMLFNAETRLLSGVWYDPAPGKCTEGHLEMAKDNLQNQFDVVGLQERFDESLMLLKRAFHWKDVRYHSENVSGSRPSVDELSPKTVSLLESANRLDRELYEFGKKLFEDRIEGLEEQIRREVALLRVTNYIDKVTFPIRRHSLRTFIRNRRSD
jgi:hypothetical protein